MVGAEQNLGAAGRDEGEAVAERAAEEAASAAGRAAHPAEGAADPTETVQQLRVRQEGPPGIRQGMPG